MVHDLKCWPDYFDAILAGTKKFELRKNDRGFNVGDVLLLHEWNPATGKYTDRFSLQRVTYMLEHSPDFGCAATFGLLAGHVIMSIIPDEQ
jgi:hypothetical protein